VLAFTVEDFVCSRRGLFDYHQEKKGRGERSEERRKRGVLLRV
jgi:hypothetical protein